MIVNSLVNSVLSILCRLTNMFIHSKFKCPIWATSTFSRTFLCFLFLLKVAFSGEGTLSHMLFPQSLLASSEMFPILPGHWASSAGVHSLLLYPSGHLNICWLELLIHGPWQSLQCLSPQMPLFCANSKSLPDRQFSTNFYNLLGAWALWLLSSYLAAEYRVLGICLQAHTSTHLLDQKADYHKGEHF